MNYPGEKKKALSFFVKVCFVKNKKLEIIFYKKTTEGVVKVEKSAPLKIYKGIMFVFILYRIIIIDFTTGSTSFYAHKCSLVSGINKR